MKFVKPRVFLVGETRVIQEGLQAYLDHVGAPDWGTDAPSDAERLCEIYGRLCYRSFEPGLNPNVTRVREGNAKYFGHLIEVGHGCATIEAYEHRASRSAIRGQRQGGMDRSSGGT